MSEKSASTVPALDKAVRILDLLAREATPLSGAEIAKLLDLPRSSVHGLIGSLLAAGLCFSFTKLPTSFLPDEDQGTLMASVQLPSGATNARTDAVLRQFEAYLAKHSQRLRAFGVESVRARYFGANAALGALTRSPLV